MVCRSLPATWRDVVLPRHELRLQCECDGRWKENPSVVIGKVVVVVEQMTEKAWTPRYLSVCTFTRVKPE